MIYHRPWSAADMGSLLIYMKHKLNVFDFCISLKIIQIKHSAMFANCSESHFFCKLSFRMAIYCKFYHLPDNFFTGCWNWNWKFSSTLTTFFLLVYLLSKLIFKLLLKLCPSWSLVAPICFLLFLQTRFSSNPNPLGTCACNLEF